MSDIVSRLQAEIRRLAFGPTKDEKPKGLGTVRFIARCPIGATDVITGVKSVLRIIDDASLTRWPDQRGWQTKLPEWFISACAPPNTAEQADQWLQWWKKLSPDEQARVEAEKDWSLGNWLYWMEPANRQWFWWDAEALTDCDHVVVAIEVDAWPFPWGALRWLFKAAGASVLEPEE